MRTSANLSWESLTTMMMASLPQKNSRLSNPAPTMMAKNSTDNSPNTEEKLILTSSLNSLIPSWVRFSLVLVLKMVKPCIGNTIGKASDPEHLRHLSKTEIQKELLEAYDLDNDNEVRWAEYQIANQFLPKVPKNLREIFRFFDKNHNWVIEHKEIQKSKPKQLVDFLGSGKRKWSHPETSHHSSLSCCKSISIIFTIM